MSIEWIFPNATPEQKERALAAALEVFASNHIEPEVAGVARMEMQLFMERGERGPSPHSEAAKAALIFIEAQNAAIAVCDAPGEALDRGHIRVSVEDDSLAGRYLRESRVLNWVDPEEKAQTPN